MSRDASMPDAREEIMTKSIYGLALRLGLAGIVAPSTLPGTLHASLPLATVPLGGMAPMVMPAARERLLFEWRGRVDKEIRVYMRGSRARVDLVGNREIDNGRVRVGSALPRADVNLRIEMLQGRGRVDVVQQPRRENGYTAVVRVRDARSGVGSYRIRAYATVPDNGWDNGRRGGRRDGGWDRRRDGDRDDRGHGGWDGRRHDRDGDWDD